MKYLAYIFSVYLFVLACLPCSDSAECSDYALASQADTHQDHSHETEACSPFCICSCCGQQVPQLSFGNPLPEPKAPLQEETKTYSLYRSSACTDFYGNIWQPPKIA